MVFLLLVYFRRRFGLLILKQALLILTWNVRSHSFVSSLDWFDLFLLILLFLVRVNKARSRSFPSSRTSRIHSLIVHCNLRCVGMTVTVLVIRFLQVLVLLRSLMLPDWLGSRRNSTPFGYSFQLFEACYFRLGVEGMSCWWHLWFLIIKQLRLRISIRH